MNKRIIAVLLLVSLVLTGLFAGGATETKAADNADKDARVAAYLESGKITDEPVSLRWLHKYPEDKYAPYFQAVADEYMAAHPNVKIKIEAVGDEPIKEKLRVMVGGGDMPDIYFSWGGEFAAKFVRAGVVEDLSKYAAADPEWSSSFADVFWDVANIEGIKAGVPLRFNAGAFVYNVKLLQELGLKAPETWTEFLHCCEVIKEAGKTPIVYGNKYPWHSAWWFTTIFREMVPEETRKADYSPLSGEWSDKGYEEAIALVQDLNEKGYLNKSVNSTTWDQCLMLFNAGEAGFFLSSVMNFPDHDSMGAGNWDWLPFPSIENGRGTHNTLAGSADLFLVSSKSAYPEVAVDFLKYLTSKDNQRRLGETGLAPVVNGSMPENTYPKILDIIDYINTDCAGMTEWFDCAVEARVADVWLENFHLMFDGKAPADILAEVREVSDRVKNEMN